MDPATAGIGSDGSPTEAAAAGSSLQLDFEDTGRYRSLNVFNPMSKSHRSILVEFFILFYFKIICRCEISSLKTYTTLKSIICSNNAAAVVSSSMHAVSCVCLGMCTDGCYERTQNIPI